MKERLQLRKAVVLSEPTRQRLGMYALTASAAGVSMLALAQPADAKIVYTKTHHVIGNNHTFPLDLNHDGSVDFLLEQKRFSSSNGMGVWLKARPFANAIAGYVGGYLLFDSALKAGAKIGRGVNFLTASYLEVLAQSFDTQGGKGYNGPWRNVSNRYLGLKFNIHGRVHYGWARLTVKGPSGYQMTSTVTGYAYETVANKAIVAGKTKGPDVITMPTDMGTLGHLALGRK